MDYFYIFKSRLKLTEATTVWLMLPFRALKDQLNKWNSQEYILTFFLCFELIKLHKWIQKDVNNCLVLW